MHKQLFEKQEMWGPWLCMQKMLLRTQRMYTNISNSWSPARHKVSYLTHYDSLL